MQVELHKTADQKPAEFQRTRGSIARANRASVNELRPIVYRPADAPPEVAGVRAAPRFVEQ